MDRRSQSDVIGVVLLTAVITVTVTGAGGVALTEWQSDIGSEPVADIESDLTLDSIELEHFGGDSVNASQTVVLLNGDEVAVPLSEFDGTDEQFTGGMEIENDEFGSVTGDVSLQVVYEPSGTVLHNEAYSLKYVLLINGESGPVFMFKEPPISYTASENTSLDVSDPSVVDLDTDSQTITGLRTGETTTITASDVDTTQTIDLSVLEPNPIAIETVDANATGLDTIGLTSELTELDPLDETDLYLRYRQQQPVEFNEDKTNNGDDIISHGEFRYDPDGYTHDNRWIHDNTPLVPGSSRTYEYVAMSQPTYLVATLRDEPELTETTRGDDFELDELVGDYYFLDDRGAIPNSGPFNVTVEYADDGGTVYVYVEGVLERTWTSGIADYDELYFSTRGSDDDLRLQSSPTLGEPQYERVASGVESPTVDTSVFRGAQPDTVYFVESHTEREIANGVVNATGKTVGVRTQKLVETRSPAAVGAESIRLRGELLTSAGGTDLSFVVEDSNGTVVATPSGPTGVTTQRPFSKTVDGLEPNSDYVYYARAEDTSSAGTPIADNGDEIPFTTDEPEIETTDRRAAGPTNITVVGELTNIAGLDEMDRYVRYRPLQPAEFNEDKNDNGDDIISHGEFRYDPDGYTHDDRWIHDNTPLVPGTSRTYEYAATSEPQYLVATLRDEPELTETGDNDGDAFQLDEFSSYYFLDDKGTIPNTGPFNVTVKYSNDGGTVTVYVEGVLERTWTSGIADYDELYFSTRGSDNDLRLQSSPTIGEPELEFIETTDSATSFTDPVSGLQPDTTYFVEAYAERTVNNQTINATGKTLAVETEKLVETRAPTAVGAQSLQLEGELLNSLGDTEVSFVVETANGTVVREPTVATGLSSPQSFNATVEGLEPDTDYVYYARAEEASLVGVSDIDKRIAVTTDEPEIETVDRRATGRSSIEVDGNLTNIAGLEEMDRYVRYRPQQPVAFNEDPTNNSDDIIAHGSFASNPDGYTHDDRWIHDNTPLVPGSNRSYTYVATSEPQYLVATLRDEPELTETGDNDGDAFQLDEFSSYYFLDDKGVIPNSGPFNVTVEYTDDGRTVNVYVEGVLERTWTSGIAGYDELYFSTRGSDNDLRLQSSPTLGEPRLEFIETTESPTNFTDPVVGLQPDTFYFVEAYAERTINGQTITATGQTLAVETESLVETRSPTAVGAESVQLEGELLDSLGDTDISFVVETADGTEIRNTTVATGLDGEQAFNTTVEGLEPNTEYVYYARAEESGGTIPLITDTGKEVIFTTDKPELETVDRRATGPSSIEVDGELTNIARLEEMDRYVHYQQQQPVEFNEDRTNNSDEIISHGEFRYDPDGYTHDNRWIHDNTPLVPGTSRTYEYVATSEPSYLVATLRDEPELTETGDNDGDAFQLDELSSYYFLDDKGTIPSNGPFNVTVEYAADGEAVNVYVGGALEQRWTSGIDTYDELYFSTRGDDTALRLRSAPTLGDSQSEFIETTDSATSFTDPVSGLQPDTTYFVEAYAERTVNGQTITATGKTLAVHTEKLVETLAPTAVGAESVQLEGEVRNSLGDTNVSFVVETPDGTELRNTTVDTGLSNQQEFSTTIEGLEPNSEYVYYTRATESGGITRITDVGDTVGFTTDEPEIETVDRRATDASSIEVDGNLTNIARLGEMDRSVRYRQQQPVEFNDDPTNNSDDVIAHGTFASDPDGYTHDNYWIHDNTPLVPGTSRTYEYVAMSPPSYLLGTLREAPELTETRDREQFQLTELNNDGQSYYFLDDRADIPDTGPFNVTVNYAADGETVTVYVEGVREQTWTTGIADDDELYFSTRGEDNTLRLRSSPTLGAPEFEFIETTDSPTNFTDPVSGLQPDTTYFVEAYAERTINGQTITATGQTLAVETESLVETRTPTAVTAESVQLEGELINSLGDTDISFVVETSDGTEVRNRTVSAGLDSQQAFNTTIEGLEPNSEYVYYARADESGGATRITDVGKRVTFTTDEPEIETIDRSATGPNSIEIDGNLTDIGGLEAMDLSVRYQQQQPAELNENRSNNSDDIISHGEFKYSPDGYTHDNRWIHDNTPLVPGSNRSYEYVATSQPTYFVATLRDGPELTETEDADGEAFQISELDGDYHFLDDTGNIPNTGPFDVTVEYTDDGETVNVYVEGALAQTWTSGIADYDELYFSTRGDDNALRLRSAPTLGEPQLEFIETTDSPTNFTHPVSGLEPDTIYHVEAYANRTVNGQTINATGKALGVQTDGS